MSNPYWLQNKPVPLGFTPNLKTISKLIVEKAQREGIEGVDEHLVQRIVRGSFSVHHGALKHTKYHRRVFVPYIGGFNPFAKNKRKRERFLRDLTAYTTKINKMLNKYSTAKTNYYKQYLKYLLNSTARVPLQRITWMRITGRKAKLRVISKAIRQERIRWRIKSDKFYKAFIFFMYIYFLTI